MCLPFMAHIISLSDSHANIEAGKARWKSGRGGHMTLFWPMRCEQKSVDATSAPSSFFLPIMRSWDAAILEPFSDRNESRTKGTQTDWWKGVGPEWATASAPYHVPPDHLSCETSQPSLFKLPVLLYVIVSFSQTPLGWDPSEVGQLGFEHMSACPFKTVLFPSLPPTAFQEWTGVMNEVEPSEAVFPTSCPWTGKVICNQMANRHNLQKMCSLYAPGFALRASTGTEFKVRKPGPSTIGNPRNYVRPSNGIFGSH